MGLMLQIVILWVLVSPMSCKECIDSKCITTNTSHTEDGVVIKHGCSRVGYKLYQCSLIILVKQEGMQDQQGCVAISNVSGIHQFCESHVIGLRGPPAPPGPQVPPSVSDDEEGDVTESPEEEAVDLRNEYITCFETEVLVGVAIGCFVFGCFVTWAIITVAAQCKSLQKELTGVQTSTSIRSIGYPRNTADVSSASANQRLLSNGSVESFPSSNLCSSQHLGQSRRPSEDTRQEDGGNGRPFQMRQPLPALPRHDVTLQPYYAQPIDSLYTTYTSDKDYQSIQGGSEHYAPVSEGGDYTSLKSQRVMVVREDNSKQVGTTSVANDYCSLKSERGSRDEVTDIYYPVSDSSNRDYTSLIDDSEVDNYNSLHHREQSVSVLPENLVPNINERNDNIKFQVNGFVGFDVSKRARNETMATLEPLDNTAEMASEAISKSNNSVTSHDKTMSGRMDDVVDGYEVLKGKSSDTNTYDRCGGMYSEAYSDRQYRVRDLDGVALQSDKTPGSENARCDDVIDFHDYETCNGSIHEYFILEEASTSV